MEYVGLCDECGRERTLHRSGGDHLCDECLRGWWEDDADELVGDDFRRDPGVRASGDYADFDLPF